MDCHDELRDLLIANLAYFKCDAQNADLHYTVGRSDGESYFITAPRNSHTGVTKGLFLAMFERELTVDLQLQRPDLFFLHAAALQFEGKCVLVAAPSGTGKSTLAWALVNEGFQYMSDELAPLDPDSLTVHPYPHALCLKAMPPGPYALPTSIVRTNRSFHVPTALLPLVASSDPVRVSAVVFLDRSEGKPQIRSIRPAKTGSRLLQNALNSRAHPNYALPLVTRIAHSVSSYRLSATRDLETTCKLMRAVLISG